MRSMASGGAFLIAIDEVGYVPMADVGAEFLFQEIVLQIQHLLLAAVTAFMPRHTCAFLPQLDVGCAHLGLHLHPGSQRNRVAVGAHPHAAQSTCPNIRPPRSGTAAAAPASEGQIRTLFPTVLYNLVASSRQALSGTHTFAKPNNSRRPSTFETRASECSPDLLTFQLDISGGEKIVFDIEMIHNQT